MEETLMRHSINVRANKEQDFKKWLAEIKCLDDKDECEWICGSIYFFFNAEIS